MLEEAHRQYQPWFEARKEAQGWVDDRGLWLNVDQKPIIPPDEGLQ